VQKKVAGGVAKQYVSEDELTHGAKTFKRSLRWVKTNKEMYLRGKGKASGFRV